MDNARTWTGLVIAVSMILTSVMFYGLGISIKSVASLIFVSALYVWLVSPYIMLVYYHRQASGRLTSTKEFVMVTLVSMLGLGVMTDVIYIHPDPQGAIALMMVPLLQFGGILATAILKRN